MALYTDAGSAPSSLLRDITSQTIGAPGVTEADAADLALAAGNYWLAVRVAPSASLSFGASTTNLRCVRNTSIPSLDTPWPATFGAATCSTAGTFNLYAVTYR
jgi:hypothetical protein